MVDITLLGNSALIPLPERAETAATLMCEGHTILFDCGEGTQCAARNAHVSLIKTDMIALTHYHGDHIFGLPGLLQTMTMMGRTETLYITGPEGIEEALKPIMDLVGWHSYEIKLIEMPEQGIKLAELFKGWPEKAHLSAFATDHRIASQGYVFTLDRVGKFMPQRAKELGVPQNMWGKIQKGETIMVGEMPVTPEMVLGPARKGIRFVFSGDTAQCDNLMEASKEADLLICEATYGENEQAQLAVDHGHMNFAQAAEVAKKAGAKRLWLTHFSQMIENPLEYLPNAQAIFTQAECGVDGKSITLEFEK